MSGIIPGNFNFWNVMQNRDAMESLVNQSMTKKSISGTAIPFINANFGANLINPSTIGLDTFQKMYEKDDVIPVCLDYHIATLIESIGAYRHENKEIQEHIRYVIKNLKNGFSDLISKMYTAKWAGFSVQEMYIEYDDFLQAHCVKDTFLLPPLTILFQANNDGRVARTYQYVINALVPAYSNLLSQVGGDGEVDPLSSKGNYTIPIRTMTVNPVGLVEIDPDNIIHYVNTGLTGLENPYGVSILDRVHGLHITKWGMIASMAVAFQRRAVPYTIVYANSQQELAIKGKDGNIIWKGNAVEAAQNTWAEPNSTDIFIMPGKKGELYEVDVVDSTGNLMEFESAIKDINLQTMRALQVPDAIFGSPTGSSYALGSSQGTVFRTFADADRDKIVHCICNSFVRKNIELAFTDKEHGGNWGTFDTRVMSIDDKLKYSKLFTELKTLGTVRLKFDGNEIRHIFDFNPVDEKELKQMGKEQESQAIEENQPKAGNPKQNNMKKRDLDDVTKTTYAHSNREDR